MREPFDSKSIAEIPQLGSRHNRRLDYRGVHFSSGNVKAGRGFSDCALNRANSLCPAKTTKAMIRPAMAMVVGPGIPLPERTNGDPIGADNGSRIFGM